MTQEGYKPLIDEFLDMLVDLLAEKYFERIDYRMKKIPELKRLITAKEASQYLSLSIETIYRMASQKKLPYLKVGDRILFDLKTLDKWIDKRLIKEKESRKEELKVETERGKGNLKSAKGSDLLELMKKVKKE